MVDVLKQRANEMAGHIVDDSQLFLDGKRDAMRAYFDLKNSIHGDALMSIRQQLAPLSNPEGEIQTDELPHPLKEKLYDVTREEIARVGGKALVLTMIYDGSLPLNAEIVSQED